MRFFDVDLPFAIRRRSLPDDVDRALDDDLETDSISRRSSISTSTVRRHEAPAVQAPANYIETTSVLTTSSMARHVHPLSGESSSVSSETLFTDYGLHRALNSLTISNTHIHAATKKARKNLRYLEDMRATHDKTRNELDLAIDAYEETFTLRDANDDPKLEGALNRQFLEANNRLARASREYERYIDDLNELRHFPKVSRATLQSAYSDRKVAAKLDRQDEHNSMRVKLHKRQQEAQELENMRRGIILENDPIRGLTQYIKRLEHERDSLQAERNRLEAEQNTLVAERKDLLDERQSLQNDGAFKTEWAVDLDRLLKDTVARHHSMDLEVKSYKSQLSFAKAETTRYRDENRGLRRDIQDLNYNLAGASEEIGRLEAANESLRSSNAHLRSEFEEVHGQALNLQRRYSDVTMSGRRSVMEPVPFNGRGGGDGAGLARSLSIQEMLDESETMEPYLGDKAMSL